MKKLYMAYNHNGTELMKKPGTEAEAKREAEEYSHATGNGSYVDKVEQTAEAKKGKQAKLG